MSSTGKRAIIREILGALRAIDGDIERVEELAASRLGINLTDFRCLDVLSRGEPMTAGQLAGEAGLTTGAATALIDRLERSGYVERLHDPTDRRRVLVAPTRRSVEKVWPFFEGIVTSSTEILNRFSLAELQVIARFLNANRKAVRAQLDEVRFRG
jgi:DNA-binding MarR family transcriptional regulator